MNGRVRVAIGLVGALCIPFLTPLICRGATAPDWKQYRNSATGLTFRYPPSLHVVEDDPRLWGLAPLDANIRLLTDRNGLVLRFRLNHGNDRLTSIGNNCKPIRLGGQEAAFECIDCIPACFWSVEVLTPRSCTIDAQGTPPLADGDEPLRSIIETARFEDTPLSSMAGNIESVKPRGSAQNATIFVTNYNVRKNMFSSNGNTMTAYRLDKPGELSLSFLKKTYENSRGIAVDQAGQVYIVNQGSGFQSWPSIEVYPSDASENSGPLKRICGATLNGASDATHLHIPNGVALDGANNVYVTDDYGTVSGPQSGRNDAIEVYPAGSTGNSKPSAAISGSDTALRDPYGIAVDASGFIYVANFKGGPSGTGIVTIYKAGSNANAKPLRTIAGSNTGLRSPTGVAVDCRGNIYVANYEGGVSETGSVTIYPPGSDGDAKPSSIIEGTNTNIRQPYGIALDNEGNLYLANYTGGASRLGSITIHRAGTNGDVAPMTVVSGPSSALDYPWAIAVRSDRCGQVTTPTRLGSH